MTPAEKLWCLDGDAPTWDGLRVMTNDDGYHRAPAVAARVDRLGLPGFAFADGPRGCVVGNATCSLSPWPEGPCGTPTSRSASAT